MKYYIGADLGTSSCKMILCDEEGTILRTVTKSYEVFYPRPGWSEQNPEDWWAAFASGVAELVSAVDSGPVCGLAVAGQMHGLVILDSSDTVIRPAILWNDGRTACENDYLNTAVGRERLAQWTANMSFAGFTAPKLLWLKEHEPENFGKIEKIMLPKDYINYRLTGVHACDYSDASGFLLLDVKQKRWSSEMLEICGVTEKQMPRLFESFQPIGQILPEIAAQLGLTGSVIVAAGAGDNAGAAVGTGTLAEGACNISLGTSGTVFIPYDHFVPVQNNSIHNFCHANGKYHLMGCILSAASCNKWFCEDILGTDDYAAEQVGITDDDLGRNHVYFLPYLMGERSPVSDTDARGVFLGMRADTKRRDMMLAVLEGVCFAIRQNLEIAEDTGLSISRSTVCGGGAKSELWMKILANVLNLPLDLPKAEEGPAYGAAILAQAAAKGEAALKVPAAELRKTVLPDAALAARYEEKYQRYVKIYPNVKDLFSELKGCEL